MGRPVGTVAVMNNYVVGNTVRLATATAFKNSAGVITDPTTVAVKYRKPDGTVVTNNAPTKDGTGLYHVDVVIDQVGEWWYRFEGHGNLEAASVASFYVETLPI